jgi:predicted RNA-binding Zn-ribbon protein involved in translation (DUF1610 family)
VRAPRVTREAFEDATANYLGFCTSCGEFTRGETEPDAGEYDCPECGGSTVTGAEDAAMLGLFRITDDEEV